MAPRSGSTTPAFLVWMAADLVVKPLGPLCHPNPAMDRHNKRAHGQKDAVATLIPDGTNDLDLMLEVLPPRLRSLLKSLGVVDPLLEVVLDLGRPAEARFPHDVHLLGTEPVTREDLRHVTSLVGAFGKDNRAGIERTLHRISAIRNRQGEIIGLTCRVGRAVYGTVEIITDVIQSGLSLLLLGRPGVGKTTLLREAARVLADDMRKRVIIVDTSNEIGGDGDVPHPGIGTSRRMQVAEPSQQHAVMIEAVENHMPEVIVIDEIGTEPEAKAARTIAERGVQLIATAHGVTLETLIKNPTLEDLLGGIQAVTLSDEEARRRDTQKTVLERRAPPTFDVVIEIRDKNQLAVHHDVASVVDELLRGVPPQPEVRVRKGDGHVEIVTPGTEYNPLQQSVMGSARPAASTRLGSPNGNTEPSGAGTRHRKVRIYPYAVSRERLERAIRDLKAPALLTNYIPEADVILTLRSQEKRQPGRLREAQARGVPLYAVRGNSMAQMTAFIREVCRLDGRGDEAAA